MSRPGLDFEISHGRLEGKIICGVDEVGRGPLAGPVMAAALILPREGLPLDVTAAIHDSKKMTAKQRDDIFPFLTKHCVYAVAEASVEEITRLNILQASLLAMRRAVAGLSVQPDHALVDGNRLPRLPCPSTPIIKGDSRSLSIAAASIIAKVTRDRLMDELAKEHPHYAWETNKGYPTAQHLAALQSFGLTPRHRTSFGPVARMKKRVG